MKPVAIGRKNRLFVDSLLAGHRAASLMSLMGSCSRCQVEPWAWLRTVLTDLPRGGSAEPLLPDTWLRQHPQHRWTIAEHRREERYRKNNL